MSEPRGTEGGASEPTTNSEISSWEEKETRPTNEDETISLEPIIHKTEGLDKDIARR